METFKIYHKYISQSCQFRRSMQGLFIDKVVTFIAPSSILNTRERSETIQSGNYHKCYCLRSRSSPLPPAVPNDFQMIFNI